MLPYIVIVTGRCPKCAATLFEDEAAARPQQGAEVTGATLLTQAELLAAERGVRRAAAPGTIKWVLAGAILLALGGASAVLVKDVVASRLGEVWAPFVFPVFLAPGIVVGSWAVAVCGRDLVVVAKRCPHCSARITAGGYAVITGNCSQCGQQVVSDPFPGMQPTLPMQGVPQWSPAEFREMAQPCGERLWIGCLVGAGLNFLWCAPLLMAISAGLKPGSSLERSAVLFAWALAIGFCQYGGVVLWRWYSACDIRCPACQRDLVDRYRLVISSHRCYHCGATVLEPHNGEASVSNKNAAGGEC
jgi:ribosomal protein S27E